MNEAKPNPEREKKIEQLVEEARFAKIVSTGNGNSLLIGGYVVDVYGQDPDIWVEVISRALRRDRENSYSSAKTVSGRGAGFGNLAIDPVEARGYSYQPGGQLKA